MLLTNAAIDFAWLGSAYDRTVGLEWGNEDKKEEKVKDIQYRIMSRKHVVTGIGFLEQLVLFYKRGAATSVQLYLTQPDIRQPRLT